MKFIKDNAGNVAVYMGFGGLLLAIAVGVAIDVIRIHKLENELQNIADSASMAAAGAAYSDNEKLEKLVISMVDQNNQTDYVFNTYFDKPVVNEYRVVLSADYQTSFMRIIGRPVAKVEVASVAASAPAGQPPHINIHFIVDDSMSMGIGQTAADQQAMVDDDDAWTTNQEPCGVACHLPPSGVTASWGQIYSTYDYYQSKGIRMRIDAVKDALTGFLDTAQSNSAQTQNTYISVTKLSEVYDNQAFKLTRNFQSAKNDVQKIELQYGDRYPWGITEIGHGLFNEVADAMGTPGDGSSSSSPVVYIVLMTDGMEHFESSSTNTKQSSDSRVDTAQPSQFIQNIDPAVCDIVKSKGANMVVMNVEYLFPAEVFIQDPIWDASPWKNLAKYPKYSGTYGRYVATNDLMPRINSTLEKCASPKVGIPTETLLYKVDAELEMQNAFTSIYEDVYTDRSYPRLIR